MGNIGLLELLFGGSSPVGWRELHPAVKLDAVTEGHFRAGPMAVCFQRPGLNRGGGPNKDGAVVSKFRPVLEAFSCAATPLGCAAGLAR